MKAVTDTFGVARSNVAERVKGTCPKRRPQSRDGDLELAAEIRRFHAVLAEPFDNTLDVDALTR